MAIDQQGLGGQAAPAVMAERQPKGEMEEIPGEYLSGLVSRGGPFKPCGHLDPGMLDWLGYYTYLPYPGISDVALALIE